MHKSVPVALVTSAALAFLLSSCGKSEQTNAAQGPVEVGVVTLQSQPVSLSEELPGRTAAYRIAEVRPQINGIIQKRLFKEGTEVKRGQQLYQIDDSPYQAALASAKAKVASTGALARRYKDLVKDRAVSQQQYDEAEAAYLEAKASEDQAEINVRYTKVYAPISGRIDRSLVTEGALVTNGQAQAMAEIRQLDPIYVDVTESINDLLKLRRELASGALQKVGDNTAKVRLKLPDGSDYPLDGTLEFSEVSVDESTGSVTLRAIFPNPDRVLLPGMYVRAVLPSGTRQNGLLVPQQGVTHDAAGSAVAMVVNDEDKVEQRKVKTERAIGTRWLINDGLKAGDRVITDGLQKVRVGVKVKPVTATNVDPQQGDVTVPAK